MALPKGINDPVVRAEWLAGQREKLAEFDRLVGKGHSASKAARAISLTLPGVHSMRQSVLDWEAGRQHGGAGGTNIDLGLALLSVLRKPGERLTYDDIAAWCGCRRQAIYAIERRALRKLRARLLEQGQDADLMEQMIEFPTRTRLRHAA